MCGYYSGVYFYLISLCITYISLYYLYMNLKLKILSVYLYSMQYVRLSTYNHFSFVKTHILPLIIIVCEASNELKVF